MMEEKQIDEMEQKIKKILREQYSLIQNKNTSLGRRLLEEHNRLKGMLDIIEVIKGNAVFYEQPFLTDKVYLGVRVTQYTPNKKI